MSLLDQPAGQSSPEYPDPSTDSPLRKLLPYTTVLIVIAALWVAWTFYSRHEDNARAAAEIEQKKEQAQKDVDESVLQHGDLAFTTFEAADGIIKRGQSTELCYGVVNAKTVKIDPPVENIKPSVRHCMDISPKKTTTYTITADNGAGQTKSASLTVRVQ